MTFKYQRRTKDSVRERANQRSGDFDSIFKPMYKLYKVREGKNLIRVFPPTWENADHYGLDIYVNYNIGADNQAYLSLNKMQNAKDPLHEARRQAERDGDDDIAKALKPRKRVLMWILDRMDEEIGPQLLSAPVTLDKGIAGASFDEDTNEMLYIDDPKEGYDVRFYREGSGLNTDYPGEKIRLINKGPIHEDASIQAEWLEYVAENPLPDCLNFYSYDYISEAFNGNVKTRNEDDEDKPKKAVVKKTSKREDHDDPPFEEEKKPSRVRAKAKEPNPEPEETEVEEVEPEAKPSIKERLAKAKAAMASRKRPSAEEED